MELSKEMKQEIGNTKYAYQLRNNIVTRIDFDCADTCEDGSSWVEGAYGNMKIYNKYHGASPIYLFTLEQYEKVFAIICKWCDLYDHPTEKITDYFEENKKRILSKLWSKHAEKIIYG